MIAFIFPGQGSQKVGMGKALAEAVLALLQESGVRAEAIRAIGSHGQTVWHSPRPAPFAGRTVRENGNRGTDHGHGNAMLVAGSIYEACKFYELFAKTELKGKCAIVTSYMPTTADAKGEAAVAGPLSPVKAVAPLPATVLMIPFGATLRTRSGRSFSRMTGPVARITARSTTFCSSRTFPGQG